MVSWFSNWTQGIIVAVIIASIIEIILPQGNNKKYIRVVIGMYILLAIVSPIIGKISNGKINLAEVIDTSSYATEMEKSSNKINSKLEANSSRSIKDIYIENLENDIKNNLKQKGYKVTSIYITANDDENYTIKKINLSLEKLKQNGNEESNINMISIKINSNENDISSIESKISSNEKSEINKYLADTYSLSENIINIE
jgi:stage III sporulation protein AF